jgi:phosphoribosylanthranilate isomerase
MVQVKVCGLTRPEQAEACSALGVDAVGLVFYPKSPRFVSIPKAKEIRQALSREIPAVGVFVNETFEAVMGRVRGCCLDMVQLHGQESPGLVAMLAAEGVPVIKALFSEGEPGFSDTRHAKARALLAECAGGALPGGCARLWDWSEAKGLSNRKPLILAGGLDPENVAEAIAMALPDAVDVSSGVERSPGDKDTEKIRRFLEAARGCAHSGAPRRIF